MRFQTVKEGVPMSMIRGVELDPIRTLRLISGASSTGRVPSFVEAHAMKALELIGSGGGIGRQQLSRELNLGEGVVRTLIRRMSGRGLIDTSRSGMVLTRTGKEALSRLMELVSATEMPETPITVGSRNYAVLVRGAADSVMKGIEQRDAAMMAGAMGATTLVYEGGRLQMPGMEMDVSPSVLSHLLESLRPRGGDAIIIGSAEELLAAEIGAKSAALKLLEMSAP